MFPSVTPSCCGMVSPGSRWQLTGASHARRTVQTAGRHAPPLSWGAHRVSRQNTATVRALVPPVVEAVARAGASRALRSDARHAAGGPSPPSLWRAGRAWQPCDLPQQGPCRQRTRVVWLRHKRSAPPPCTPLVPTAWGRARLQARRPAATPRVARAVHRVVAARGTQPPLPPSSRRAPAAPAAEDQGQRGLPQRRRKLPADCRVDEQPCPRAAGQGSCMRRVSAQGAIKILAQHYRISKRLTCADIQATLLTARQIWKG